MKKLLALLAFALSCVQVQAQNVEGQIIASQFGSYLVPGLQTGSLQFEPATCLVSGGGKNFAAFTTGVPVKIIDSNPALNEIATPAAVFISSCAISMSTQHIHSMPFYATSGTGGLQEAILNGLTKGGGPNTIILNADWYTQVAPGNPATVIASVRGNATIGLIDVTQTPYVFYSWNGSQYVQVAFAGGFIPATSSVLCGTGTLGSSVACGALPNGTTATTQSNGDNSTKIATTAYVAANAGGPTLPTNALVFGTGPTTSRAAVPGPDFFPSITPAFSGQAIISNGTTSTSWVTASVPQSFPGAVQYIQQPTSDAIWTTLGVNNLNNVFYVDGYAQSGIYSGVGQAPVAWTGGTGNLGIGQVVTYSGNNYIAVQSGNGATTPGTNVFYWMKVPNAQASTPIDIAWYSAQAWKHFSHRNALVVMGSGEYDTLGLVDYVDGSGFDDQNSVGLEGCGENCSYLKYTGSAATPVVNRPTGSGNFTSFLMHDMTIDGGATASAAIEIGSIGGSEFRNIAAGHVLPGADHVMQFGHSAGDAFQVAVNNINIGIFPDTNHANCGVFVANVVGGSVTSYTVSTPGTCYAAASASNVFHVQLTGYGSGLTATQPCTVMPTGQVVTLSGTGVASISEGSNTGGSGCSGTIYVQVWSSTPVNYGIIFDQSDSHDIHEITSYLGDTAAFIIGASNDSFHGLHPSVVANGVITQLAADIVGTECDAVFNRCFIFNQPFTGTAASVVGTSGYIGCSATSRLLVGSSMYYLASSSANINFGTSASLQDASGVGCNTGWQEFVTQSGPITSQATYLTNAPPHMTAVGNDFTAGETMGDYIPTLTVNNLNVASCTGCGGSGALTPTSVNVQPLGTATSGGNFGAGADNQLSSIWTGSVASNCLIGWINSPNSTGTNPAVTYGITNSGCGSGGITVNLGSLPFVTSGRGTFSGGITGVGNSYSSGTYSENMGTAIAAASTIAPLALITHITGTAATVETITPPSSCAPGASYMCEIKLVSDAGFSMGLTGNIAAAVTTVTGQLYLLAYDYNTSKWYPTN